MKLREQTKSPQCSKTLFRYLKYAGVSLKNLCSFIPIHNKINSILRICLSHYPYKIFKLRWIRWPEATWDNVEWEAES